MPEFAALLRAPVWLIVVLLLAAIGVGIYAYFTTPLPYGLGTVIRTPAGAAVGEAPPQPTPGASVARAPAGQALVLGAARVSVQGIQRNQDLNSNNRGGPPGNFTVVDLMIQNGGTQPLTPQPADFQLVDDQGRVYAVDPEATRAVNTTARRRVLFEASVPPAATLETLVAFEMPADSGGLALRVRMGYGELELPR